MFKIYFSEWGEGKLQRLPYFGYHLLLIFFVVALIFAGIFAVGATENIMGGDLAATQELLTDKFGIIAIFVMVAIFFIALLGQVNILGKRIRDIGLPVLWTILGLVVVSIALNVAFPPQEVALSAATIQSADGSATAIAASTTTANTVVQIFDAIVFLCLVFIPSNAFGAKNH